MPFCRGFPISSFIYLSTNIQSTNSTWAISPNISSTARAARVNDSECKVHCACIHDPSNKCSFGHRLTAFGRNRSPLMGRPPPTGRRTNRRYGSSSPRYLFSGVSVPCETEWDKKFRLCLLRLPCVNVQVRIRFFHAYGRIEYVIVPMNHNGEEKKRKQQHRPHHRSYRLCETGDAATENIFIVFSFQAAYFGLRQCRWNWMSTLVANGLPYTRFESGPQTKTMYHASDAW